MFEAVNQLAIFLSKRVCSPGHGELQARPSSKKLLLFANSCDLHFLSAVSVVDIVSIYSYDVWFKPLFNRKRGRSKLFTGSTAPGSDLPFFIITSAITLQQG
jgi:hypothetical protein